MLPSDPLREGALAVLRTLRGAGFRAFFAGGCVRDRVLGLSPKDYDIATDARPESVMALFSKTVPVGVQFGVVRVLIEHHQYEVATFRAEAAYTDGRRPSEVRWADAQADVLRRDFTINGLLEDPLAPGGGEVLDFVGGQADLQARLVRAIGDPMERFLEDYLRVLRCVRFAARMEFQIHPATWSAAQELGPYLTKISPERIAQELGQIVTQGHQARGLGLLAAADFLPHVLPEIASAERLERAIARLRQLGPCDEVLGWGTLLLDGSAALASLGKRLRWSRALVNDVTEVVQTAQHVMAWDTLPLAAKKRAARRGTFGAALVIAGTAGYREQEAMARAALMGWTPDDLRPKPLLTGDDLVHAGHTPGKAFAVALEALESAQLEGRATTPEEAWQVVRKALGS